MNILSSADPIATDPTAREWSKLVAPFATPNDKRGVLEILITVTPFFIFWALAAFFLVKSNWLGLLFILPASAFLLRMFLIQHDCGHDSFFSSRKANNWVGRGIGVLTFTPYFYWQRAHAIHHASSGHLERRGWGDITTLTVDEYNALGIWGRLRYRAYRHPITLFGIGPAYTFILEQRWPVGMERDGWKPWISVMGTNLGIALLSGFAIWLVGWKVFLIIQLPAVLIAATIGIWLFYVQHQFEETVWDHDEEWAWAHAAFHGSSHYDLPQPLKWFSANIGLHHIHHLSAKVPYYRLPDVIKEFPMLADINRLTLWESFKCVPLALWDESRRTMVSFRSARAA